MSSRTRVLRALNHQEPDRTPIFEYVILSPLADQILGRPYLADPVNRVPYIRENGWEKARRQEAIDRVELALKLGHDLLFVPPPPPENQPTPPAVPDELEDPVERIEFRNRQYRQFAGHPQDRFLIYQYLREEMNRHDFDLALFAPTYDHGVWDDVDLMQTMLLDEDVAHEHFSHATRSSLSFIENYLQWDIDLIGVGGDFSGNQPLISPDLYKKFIVPEVARLSRSIHQAGKWSINASDGNLWPVIDDFFFGCEVDGYIEIDLHAGMELPKLKAEYGERITFLGNLDCGNIMSFATPAQVRQHTLDCLEAGQPNGGHILTASNAITASVPLENYLAVVAAYRDFFILPPLSILQGLS